MRKVGIVLINLGTPDEPKRSAVDRYLRQFLLDRRVIDIPWLQRQLLVRGIIVPFRAGNSTKLYQQLWTDEGSPLKIYGEIVRDAIQEKVGPDTPVVLAMRYQNPSVREALKALWEARVTEIIVFPMFPQYASASTGSALEAIMLEAARQEVIPSMTVIQDYYDHPAFIDVIVDHANQFDLRSYDHFLFSYHGIPQRQLVKADIGTHCLQNADCCRTLTLKNRHCYSAQCYATTNALVEQLKLREDQYTTCFQSRLGKDPWTQPYTSQVLKERAAKGDRKILVFSPAFVADCLETTIEVGVEYQEEFEELGGERLDLVPSLNDDPKWIEAILQIIDERANR